VVYPKDLTTPSPYTRDRFWEKFMRSLIEESVVGTKKTKRMLDPSRLTDDAAKRT
jgi:hypothetical protein